VLTFALRRFAEQPSKFDHAGSKSDWLPDSLAARCDSYFPLFFGEKEERALRDRSSSAKPKAVTEALHGERRPNGSGLGSGSEKNHYRYLSRLPITARNDHGVTPQYLPGSVSHPRRGVTFVYELPGSCHVGNHERSYVGRRKSF
jgi:hypothetical protein